MANQLSLGRREKIIQKAVEELMEAVREFQRTAPPKVLNSKRFRVFRFGPVVWPGRDVHGEPGWEMAYYPHRAGFMGYAGLSGYVVIHSVAWWANTPTRLTRALKAIQAARKWVVNRTEKWKCRRHETVRV